MKLVQIAGYLGSGKTTLILALVRALSGAGKQVAILVNDVGEVPVDGKVMQEFGLTVKDIGGGCICCQVGRQPDLDVKDPHGKAETRYHYHRAYRSGDP